MLGWAYVIFPEWKKTNNQFMNRIFFEFVIVFRSQPLMRGETHVEHYGVREREREREKERERERERASVALSAE